MNFVIKVLPIIDYMDEIAKKMLAGNGFNLFGGTSAETSGGLLVALSKEEALVRLRSLNKKRFAFRTLLGKWKELMATLHGLLARWNQRSRRVPVLLATTRFCQFHPESTNSGFFFPVIPINSPLTVTISKSKLL